MKNQKKYSNEELVILALFNGLFQKMGLKELAIQTKIKHAMDAETNNHIKINFADPMKMINDRDLDKIVEKYSALLIDSQRILNKYKEKLQLKLKEELKNAKENAKKTNEN